MARKTTDEIFDIAVIGAGPAGLTAACLLTQDGLRVACLDRRVPDVAAMPERALAVSAGARAILQQAGVGDCVIAQGCPIRRVDVRDGDSPVLLSLLGEDSGGRDFGWNMPGRALYAALLVRAHDLGVTFIAPADVAALEIAGDAVHVLTEAGKTVAALLAIGADGRHSRVRDLIGVRVRAHDYRQRAITGIVTHQHLHHNVAIEHFRAEGPLAVLPLPDDDKGRCRSSFVVVEPAGSRARSLMNLSDAEFRDHLAGLFPENYGKIELAGSAGAPRAAHDLLYTHALDYVKNRVVLVADAAHTIHPVAAQGLNLGLQDVAALCKAVLDAHKTGRDIGAPDVLEAYHRARRFENTVTAAAMDMLARLSGGASPLRRLLRRAGMRGIDALPGLRRGIVRAGMGNLTGRG